MPTKKVLVAAALAFPWGFFFAAIAMLISQACAVESAVVDTPMPHPLYVPRCAPAFAGRALVCTDGPRAVTVEVLP